ncbi:hypothetical protein EJ110_NYTH35722 [Nymphaea thermarum]|nr:hypothetical protein EJ110_NYTH35722 [Nymphaea thermarum]
MTRVTLVKLKLPHVDEKGHRLTTLEIIADMIRSLGEEKGVDRFENLHRRRSCESEIALGRKFNHEEGGYGKSRLQDALAMFQASVGAFFVGLAGLHCKLLSDFHDLDCFYEEVIRGHSDPRRRPNGHLDH